MQFLVRMDDITADMDWKKFSVIRELLDSYGIKALIGVVPDCKDKNLSINPAKEDFWDIVKDLQKKGWVIAQHGTYHEYVTEDSGLLGINPFSEFAGLSFDEQKKKIEYGKKRLKEHGIYTDIFMAPGHSYDENTLTALKEVGFRAITDGLYNKPYIYNDILCVPCRLNGSFDIKDFDTICIHSNTITDTQIEKLKAFLGKHYKEALVFDVDSFRTEAPVYNESIRAYEEKALKLRNRKKGLGENPRIRWYLQLTDHKNKKLKMIKRLFFIPMLLFYKKDKKYDNAE